MPGVFEISTRRIGLPGGDQLACLHQVGPRLPVLPQGGPASRAGSLGMSFVQAPPTAGQGCPCPCGGKLLRAAPRVRLGTLAMAIPKRKILRSGTGLSQTTGLPRRCADALPSGSASAASRALRIAAACMRGSAVPGFPQRIDDGEEVRLAAPMRLAVTLDETGAFGDLEASPASALPPRRRGPASARSGAAPRHSGSCAAATAFIHASERTTR